MRKKTSAGTKRTAPKKTAAGKKIVIIGASAGGLEAISALLKNLPSDTGMTYFYIQHLNPNHTSNLTSLLSSATQMKVEEARTGRIIRADRVYVSTPNKEITLLGNRIKLTPRKEIARPYLPIDQFFSAVARKYKERVIGVILSGNAGDGTEGLKAVTHHGGSALIQDKSAKFNSMPRSAAAGNPKAQVLSLKEIAKTIVNTASGVLLKEVEEDSTIIPDDSHRMKTILDILRKETQVDFSHYKRSTLKRRLTYRMLSCNVATLDHYIQLLQKNQNEAGLLQKDLLINVTEFFRDPKAFRYLRSTIFPKLIKSKSPNETLRIWVPACSTGEEAYSMAMVIHELQEKLPEKIPVQIFATDLSEPAVQAARAGEFCAEDTKNLSQQVVKKFFNKSGEGYRIIKEIREMCVFAHHNILSDPPFSRMDFISCCNLLIYFDAVAQKKVIATLNFALSPDGILMLGKSETVGSSSPFFKPAHSRLRIYLHKLNPENRKVPELLPRVGTGFLVSKKSSATPTKNSANSKHIDSAVDNLLLSLYTPACVLVNRNAEILKFRGNTAQFLSQPHGNATLNIFKMARSEFSMELRHAFKEAIETGKAVSKENLELTNNGASHWLTIQVSPVPIDWDEPLFLVMFTLHQENLSLKDSLEGKAIGFRTKQRLATLKEEVFKTRAEMHSIIESQEIAYEELQAANEEIVSTNEEFQTLNEELETSKEEIEATNEELISTNQELQMRNDLLSESYEYSEAIIATIHEPLLILDNQLRVASANKSYYRKFMVTPEEITGVSLFDLEHKLWDLPQLRTLLKQVITKNTGFNNFEVKYAFRDLGEKIMLLNAHRIVQKTHREQFVLLAIEDVTERTKLHQHEKEILKKDIRIHKAHKLELEEAVKKRTRQLERKNVELEELNKDLTSFTYVSSHDLQEPLRKIRNFVSVLIEEEFGKLSKEGQHYLNRTYATANRMQTLIEDLLTYSRTKNLERKFEDTNLKEFIEEIRADYDDPIKEGKILLKNGHMNSIRVIRFQFRQLLQNLISNSVKFAKPSTMVTVNISSSLVSGAYFNRKHRLPDRNRLLADHNYCHIIYTDNGIGFDPQYNERVFNVFQRLHNDEDYSGSGMGLAICQRIIENHRGVILASGKVNKGVRFDICIPVHKPTSSLG